MKSWTTVNGVAHAGVVSAVLLGAILPLPLRAQTNDGCDRTQATPCSFGNPGARLYYAEPDRHGVRHGGPLASPHAEHHGGPRADALPARGFDAIFPAAESHGFRYPWQTGSENRLRVISLWRAGSSSLSLQARHGREASLQWNMPFGDGTYRPGLLDSWLGRSP